MRKTTKTTTDSYVMLHDCLSLKSRFDPDNWEEWDYWHGTVFGLITQPITMIDYETAHSFLGCKMLNLLAEICPDHIFLPVVILLCQSREHVVSIKDFMIMYRTEDQAVGVDFVYYKMYLLPRNFQVYSTVGFEYLLC
jgi:hypothetical protein